MQIASEITLIILNYNDGETLYPCAAAMANQTLRPQEIIIVDDGSTDHSSSVLDLLEKNYPFIRVIRQPTNQGIHAAYTKALANVKTRFFATCGADDPLTPQFVAEAHALCIQYPDLGIIGAEHILEAKIGDNRFSYQSHTIGSSDPTFLSPEGFADVYKNKKHSFFISTTPILWRTEAFHEAGGLLTDLEWTSDWFAALVIARRHGMGYIPKVLQTVNFNINSCSQKGQKDLVASDRVLKNIIRKLEGPGYSDVRDFFRTPSILAHYGITLIQLFRDDQYAWLRSIGLLKAAAIAEGVALGESFENSKLPLAELWHEAIPAIGLTLFNKSCQLAQQGQLHEALKTSLRAAHALPDDTKIKGLSQTLLKLIAKSPSRPIQV